MSTPAIPPPDPDGNWTMTIATYVAPNDDGTFAAYIQVVAQGPGDRGVGQLIPVPTTLYYGGVVGMVGMGVQGPNSYPSVADATTAIEAAVGALIPVNHLPQQQPQPAPGVAAYLPASAPADPPADPPA